MFRLTVVRMNDKFDGEIGQKTSSLAWLREFRKENWIESLHKYFEGYLCV